MSKIEYYMLEAFMYCVYYFAVFLDKVGLLPDEKDCIDG